MCLHKNTGRGQESTTRRYFKNVLSKDMYVGILWLQSSIKTQFKKLSFSGVVIFTHKTQQMKLIESVIRTYILYYALTPFVLLIQMCLNP